MTWEPIDIEDLAKDGQLHHYCPFYGQKERANSAEIIFMSYNYLLDPFAKKSSNIDFDSTVIIIDEGHNIAT